MNNELKQTAQVIVSAEQSQAKLDYQMKRVLACKPILSRILKETVEECRDMEPEEIEQYIENVEVDKVPSTP